MTYAGGYEVIDKGYGYGTSKALTLSIYNNLIIIII